MQLTDVTALARPIDPRYPTNLAISVASLVVAAGGAVYRVTSGDGWLDALLWGVGAAFAVFLAWALARELDPDHDLSAFVAAALAVIGLISLGQPALLPLFWLLLLLRVVNRTTGVPARPLDSLGVLGLAGWLAWQDVWPAALVTALGFLLDALLPNPLRRHLAFAGLALLALVATGIGHEHATDELFASADWVVIGGVAALWVVVVYTSDYVTSRGDVTGQRLSVPRVQAAQGLALLAAFLWAWQLGQEGVVDLMPVWAAMLGVGLWRLGLLVFQGYDTHQGEGE